MDESIILRYFAVVALSKPPPTTAIFLVDFWQAGWRIQIGKLRRAAKFVAGACGYFWGLVAIFLVVFW